MNPRLVAQIHNNTENINILNAAFHSLNIIPVKSKPDRTSIPFKMRIATRLRLLEKPHNNGVLRFWQDTVILSVINTDFH